MKHFYLMLFCLLSSVFGSYSTIHTKFQDFINTYNKTYYTVSEYNYKYNIFKYNVEYINYMNYLNNSYKLSINNYTDINHTEFTFDYNKYSLDNKLFGDSIDCEVNHTLLTIHNSTIPDSVDWRQKGGVTTVKNQGNCGSCWAFSAVEAVEGLHAIRTNNLLNLSEQELIDCSENDGCNGGLMDSAFNYIINNGICALEEYPYAAKKSKCKKCKNKIHINGCSDVPYNNETALMAAVALQPISIAIEADKMAFQFYSSGVFDGKCGTNLDHGVLLVGYGTENGKDYWLVKNSWGSHWGENGYIKIKRNVDNVEGHCGIAMQPSYPV